MTPCVHSDHGYYYHVGQIWAIMISGGCSVVLSNWFMVDHVTHRAWNDFKVKRSDHYYF